VTAARPTGHDPIVRTAIALLGVLLGCGGQVAGGQDAGSSSTGPAESQDAGTSQQDDTGGPTTVALCPTTPPSAGTPCSSPGALDCGYLDNGCQLFDCDSSGHWQPAPHCP